MLACMFRCCLGNQKQLLDWGVGTFCSLERQVQACEASASVHNSLVGQALMQGKAEPHPTGQMPTWRVQS